MFDFRFPGRDKFIVISGVRRPLLNDDDLSGVVGECSAKMQEVLVRCPRYRESMCERDKKLLGIDDSVWNVHQYFFISCGDDYLCDSYVFFFSLLSLLERQSA